MQGMAHVNAPLRRWITSRPAAPVEAASQPTHPLPPGADRCWSFAPGDAIAPGRRVVRRLGDGGVHQAFLVEHDASRYAVAKLLRPSLVRDLHRLVSLRDEGRALSRLASPGVPRHLDTVLSDPHPHLLLEYVAGPTLLTAAARPLPAPLVADLGRALALVLHGIASAGWVHLDVKPSNIVVNARPRLLDFELALPASAAANMPAPAGTWHYMPPEQRAAGRPGAPPVGPAADVFALAMTLGEAVSGRPLARARRPERIAGPLGAVLADALAPGPADRPTAAELAAGLSALAEPELTPARLGGR
jgi:serine/threonine protein kinase